MAQTGTGARRFARLAERGVLALAGEDRVRFLQGLVSNDVTRVAPARAIFAAFLTPQGKYLHDFFIAALGEELLLDVEGPRREDLRRRLSVYRLRAKVTIADAGPSLAVSVAFGEGAPAALGLAPEPGAARAFAGGAAYVDPRLAAAGVRVIAPAEAAAEALDGLDFSPADAAAYDRHRLALALPDGSRDLAVEKAILLESNFEEMNGVDWAKGCYLGQELTARTKYRGLVKKRLVPVGIEGAPPPPGTPVMLDGREAGEMRSSREDLGLALLRLESLAEAAATGAPFTAGEARIRLRPAPWARP